MRREMRRATARGVGEVLLCGVMIASALPAFAQGVTASIRGEVFDPSGAAVPGAQVTATQMETGLIRATTTNRRGGYVLVSLPIGHYRLEVSAKGFRTFIQEGITLSVNEAASVPIHLQIGSSTQAVEVVGNARLIDTTSTTLGKTVGEREILDLPLNGRNFSQLGLLQPGVVPVTPGLAEAGGSCEKEKVTPSTDNGRSRITSSLTALPTSTPWTAASCLNRPLTRSHNSRSSPARPMPSMAAKRAQPPTS